MAKKKTEEKKLLEKKRYSETKIYKYYINQEKIIKKARILNFNLSNQI